MKEVVMLMEGMGKTVLLYCGNAKGKGLCKVDLSTIKKQERKVKIFKQRVYQRTGGDGEGVRSSDVAPVC